VNGSLDAMSSLPVPTHPDEDRVCSVPATRAISSYSCRNRTAQTHHVGEVIPLQQLLRSWAFSETSPLALRCPEAGGFAPPVRSSRQRPGGISSSVEVALARMRDLDRQRPKPGGGGGGWARTRS